MHPLLAEITSPFPSEPVEYLGAQLKYLHAKGAPSEHPGTAVAGVRGSFT